MVPILDTSIFSQFIYFYHDFSYELHAFFYTQRFFSTQLLCWLTFSWIELHMLLRCCLIYTSIIILRNFLYLLYLCTYMSRSRSNYIVFMWSFFIFIFFFIMINCIISWIQTHLFFCLHLEYVSLLLDGNVYEERE